MVSVRSSVVRQLPPPEAYTMFREKWEWRIPRFHDMVSSRRIVFSAPHLLQPRRDVVQGEIKMPLVGLLSENSVTSRHLLIIGVLCWIPRAYGFFTACCVFFFEIVKLFYAVQLLRPGLVFQKHHIESLDTCMKY